MTCLLSPLRLSPWPCVLAPFRSQSPLNRVGIALLLIAIFGSVACLADGWPPDGMKVAERSASPDGRYGILVYQMLKLPPNIDEESACDVNYFADLPARNLPAKIKGACFAAGKNHQSLEVFWSPSSSFCAAVYEGRYGFDSMVAIEPTPFQQIDFGTHVQKGLDAAILSQEAGNARSANDRSKCCEGYVVVRVSNDGVIRVRAVGTTNPKQLMELQSRYAFYSGTFDFRSQKWSGEISRKISSEKSDALQVLFSSDQTGAQIIYGSEQNRASSLDDKLNQAYRSLKFLLPPARFAALKKDQIAWLKMRDACTNAVEKNNIVQRRILALLDVGWSDY